MSVSIVRLPNGMDFSHLTADIQTDELNCGLTPSDSTSNFNAVISITHEDLLRPSKMMHADSNLNIQAMISPPQSNSHTLTIPQPPPMPNQQRLRMLQRESIIYSTRGGSVVPKEILNAMSVFENKQPKGSTIDVWWLYDDGGLTVLLPYILSTRATFSNCKIRVFALTNRKLEMEIEERNMANLLSKLRIDYSSLTMLEGVTERPQESTIAMHRKLIKGFVEGQTPDYLISRSELQQLQEKTYRQLRLREMLTQHSTDAALIVMSLPMPRQVSLIIHN